jgi:hypothetical protein
VRLFLFVLLIFICLFFTFVSTICFEENENDNNNKQLFVGFHFEFARVNRAGGNSSQLTVDSLGFSSSSSTSNEESESRRTLISRLMGELFEQFECTESTS